MNMYFPIYDSKLSEKILGGFLLQHIIYNNLMIWFGLVWFLIDASRK